MKTSVDVYVTGERSGDAARRQRRFAVPARAFDDPAELVGWSTHPPDNIEHGSKKSRWTRRAFLDPIKLAKCAWFQDEIPATAAGMRRLGATEWRLWRRRGHARNERQVTFSAWVRVALDGPQRW